MSGHTQDASTNPRVSSAETKSKGTAEVMLVSLRQTPFSNLFSEEVTLKSTWFPLSEIPLENIRNL